MPEPDFVDPELVAHALSDDGRLWRRLHPDQMPDQGSTRPKSSAFKDPRMSIRLAEIAEADGGVVADLVAGYPGYGVAELLVGSCHPADVKSDHLEVVHAPIEDDRAHGEVGGRKSPALAR